MYIDYSKLWKLLIDKNMTKSDLLELTGISSRVLAKLSKNETVTTDTIARICTALNCDVSDVMECVSEDKMSVYACYRKLGKVEEKGETFKVVRFTLNGQKYTVYESKKTANGSITVRCGKNGTVLWEEPNHAGHLNLLPIVSVLVKPTRNKDEIAIVLIKGKPGCISGLDENGFVSSRNTLKNDTDIYVMSEAAFKIFKVN